MLGFLLESRIGKIVITLDEEMFEKKRLQKKTVTTTRRTSIRRKETVSQQKLIRYTWRREVIVVKESVERSDFKFI